MIWPQFPSAVRGERKAAEKEQEGYRRDRARARAMRVEPLGPIN